MQLLTHSRMSCARRCLREHYYRYEVGIVRDTEATYFRIGHAVHGALEKWHGANDADGAVAALESIDDPYDRMSAMALVESYVELTEPLAFQVAEQEFQLPLRNPETGAASRTFELAGKIDGLTEDAVIEHKTTTEYIGPDSEYWARLRVDPQISLYALASGRNKVFYNVIRRPSLRPRQIPLTDDDGIKIVIEDATGQRAVNKNGTWKQAACEGCTLQTRDETPEEYGARIYVDIRERPEFYFARREVPILDDHLTEFQEEVWQQGKLLLHCQNTGHWFRNVSRVTCGNCQYANICLQSIQLEFNADGSVRPPNGYVCEKPHRELSNVETA